MVTIAFQAYGCISHGQDTFYDDAKFWMVYQNDKARAERSGFGNQ